MGVVAWHSKGEEATGQLAESQEDVYQGPSWLECPQCTTTSFSSPYIMYLNAKYASCFHSVTGEGCGPYLQ